MTVLHVEFRLITLLMLTRNPADNELRAVDPPKCNTKIYEILLKIGDI